MVTAFRKAPPGRSHYPAAPLWRIRSNELRRASNAAGYWLARRRCGFVIRFHAPRFFVIGSGATARGRARDDAGDSAREMRRPGPEDRRPARLRETTGFEPSESSSQGANYPTGCNRVTLAIRRKPAGSVSSMSFAINWLSGIGTLTPPGWMQKRSTGLPSFKRSTWPDQAGRMR